MNTGDFRLAPRSKRGKAYIADGLSWNEVGLLFALILVLPMVEVAGLLNRSPLVLTTVYVVYAALLLAVTVLPWLNAAWARRIANKLAESGAHNLTVVVTSRWAPMEKPQLRVMVANLHGLDFIDKSGTRITAAWALSDISVVQSGLLARESIALTHGSGAIQLVPMGRNGVMQLRSAGIHRLVARLHQLRSNADL